MQTDHLSMPAPHEESGANPGNPDAIVPGHTALAAPFFVRTESCNIHRCPHCERQYDKPGIGVVVSGVLDYKAQSGAATVVPGTALFGNVGEFFNVDHLDANELEKLCAWYDGAFLEEIADAYDVAVPRFQVVALPPGKIAANIYTRLQAAARGWADPLEVAGALAVTGLAIKDDKRRRPQVSGRDRQRILSVVSHIERSFSESCSVDELAAIAGSSRFHFMRKFKAVTGLSPNQYVIATRLRAAATRIAESGAQISQIAFDCGFNDISHFTNSFRAMFGCSPRRMRH